MAFSLNKVQIIGNLTRAPEVKVAGSTKVANFGVATNFTWKDQTGQRKERVEFHNIIAWGKLAEICEQYLNKGSKIYVEGRLQTRDWEGKDGVKRYKTEIVMENMIMLDKKGAATGEVSPFQGGERTQKSIKEEAPSVSTVIEEEEEVSIDDLPF